MSLYKELINKAECLMGKNNNREQKNTYYTKCIRDPIFSYYEIIYSKQAYIYYTLYIALQ